MNERQLAPSAQVMGFIGGTSDRPAPISDKEVDAMANRLQGWAASENAVRARACQRRPVCDFNGVVEEVDYEKSRLKVSLSRPCNAG